METSRGCSCSLAPSGSRTVRTDRWLTGLLHRVNHSVRCFIHKRARQRCQREICYGGWTHHDGGCGPDFQVAMITLLPQLVGLVTLKRCFRTHCLWRMWFIVSVTQPRSTLCHVVTCSEETNSSCPFTAHILRWWTLSSLVYYQDE